MNYICLFHWKADEFEDRAEKLRRLGYRVVAGAPEGTPDLRTLREEAPDAVVIDLSRLPSGGRDVGLALRHRKSTRHIPIVFVGGDAGKVDVVKKTLPDAVYTEWEEIGLDLKSALANPPLNPKVPESPLSGYSGTPLVKKLGIRAEFMVGLVRSPAGFVEKLAELPEGVEVRRQLKGPFDLIICFNRNKSELEKLLDRLKLSMKENGSVWLVWPKKTSGIKSDLTQAKVREIGLASDLVDYKICAIDETWSGLLFTRRKG